MLAVFDLVIISGTLYGMNEKEFPKPIPKPEQDPEQDPADRNLFKQDDAYRARVKSLYENDYIEPEAPKVSLEECEQKIGEVLDLIETFHTNHPIDQLLAITDLAAKDAPDHPVREPARKDLPAIGFALRFLETQTNIAPERYIKLHALYVRLIRAVGSIRNGKVDHD